MNESCFVTLINTFLDPREATRNRGRDGRCVLGAWAGGGQEGKCGRGQGYWTEMNEESDRVIDRVIECVMVGRTCLYGVFHNHVFA